MSITGEGKTEHIKDQLHESAKDIIKTQRKIKEINDSIESNLKSLDQEISNLHTEIEKLPETVARKVEEKFIKSEATENDINISEAPDVTDKDSWIGD